MPKDMNTLQSNIRNYFDVGSGDITKYAMFVGGINATRDALQYYDPLRTGYGRLFMVRKPVFLNALIPEKFKVFKHIIEYGNTAISGINNVEMEMAPLTGGYAGKTMELPTVAKDNTNSFSVKVYDLSGSPIRDVLYTWINGTSDLLTGFSTYYEDVSGNGFLYKNANAKRLPHIQANQTAEFIYVCTDNTGKEVEYACMFANCFPKNVPLDFFNTTAGEHGLAEFDIEFSCIKYESTQINKVAKALIQKYVILSNSLNMFSGIDADSSYHVNDKDDKAGYKSDEGWYYDSTTGILQNGRPKSAA